MTRTEVATPFALDHLRALFRTIPKGMLHQTAQFNQDATYLRPSILAAFFDRFALTKKYQGVSGLKLKVTPEDTVFTVQGAHAVAALSNLYLPTHTLGAGRYIFADGENLKLIAHVSHRECRAALQQIYGPNLRYGPATMTKLGEHIGKHPAALVDATRIRIEKARNRGREIS